MTVTRDSKKMLRPVKFYFWGLFNEFGGGGGVVKIKILVNE